MKKKTQNRIRLLVTLGLLMAFGILLIALAEGDISTGRGGFSILIWLIGSPLLAFTISMIWRFKLVPIEDEQETESVEKRKRDRIDNVLRDLSDEDLLRLKQRLIDGTVDDDLLQEQLVGDDGELMVMEKDL